MPPGKGVERPLTQRSLANRLRRMIDGDHTSPEDANRLKALSAAGEEPLNQLRNLLEHIIRTKVRSDRVTQDSVDPNRFTVRNLSATQKYHLVDLAGQIGFTVVDGDVSGQGLPAVTGLEDDNRRQYELTFTYSAPE